MEARLQRRLVTKKAELDHYWPLAPGLVTALYKDLKVVLTYHSNAMEGNSLTLNETLLVIEYGLTAASHPLKDYLEATNHAQAFERLLELVDRERPLALTLEQILELHRLVMAGIHDQAGQLRTRPSVLTWFAGGRVRISLV